MQIGQNARVKKDKNNPRAQVIFLEKRTQVAPIASYWMNFGKKFLQFSRAISLNLAKETLGKLGETVVSWSIGGEALRKQWFPLGA